jgi:hypothetical protein
VSPRPWRLSKLRRRNSARSRRGAQTNMRFRAYYRTLWRKNPARRGGYEPKLGRKISIQTGIKTEQEARDLCRHWNATHEEGPLCQRAEYEED